MNGWPFTARDGAQYLALRARLRSQMWAASGLPTTLPTVTESWGGAGYAWASRVDRLLCDTGASQSVGGHVLECRLVWPNGTPRPDVVVFCAGHEGLAADIAYVQYFVDRGYRVLATASPTKNPSPTSMSITLGAESTTFGTVSHDDYQWLETRGVKFVPLFVDHVIMGLNHLSATLPNSRVHMFGLSGGGFTTDFVAAMDDRVCCSFNVAGSLPFLMRVGSDLGDWEQYVGRAAYEKFDWPMFYELRGWRRKAFNIYNQFDSCCFAANGRETSFQQIGTDVQASLGSAGRFAVRIDTSHAAAHIVSDDSLAFILSQIQ